MIPLYSSRFYCYLVLLLSLLAPISPITAKEITSPPLRIVSLGPINTENVYLLGAGDRLVGNTAYCVRPADAKEKTKVGSVMEVSVEKIASLKPDIILATQFTRPQQVKHLKRLGFKVVTFKQSVSFAEICNQFLLLGELLGLSEKAKQVIAAVQQEVTKIQQKYADKNAPKVLLQIGSRPLHVSAADSFTNDFIAFSNGINVAGKQSDGKMNYETALGTNPDVIIIAIMGSETGVAAQEKEKWNRFKGISAVKNQRIHTVDPNLVCSPSPHTFIEALEMIAKLIHPH